LAKKAGTDTTVIALSTFLYAMVKYPEFQRKAQEELDRVVGSDQLPDFGDRESLPYVMAIMYEVLRSVIEEQVYNLLFIARYIIRWQPVNPTSKSRFVK
jgi:hypothetical protein